MARIELVTDIRAPLEVCFDLSRDLDFHMRSLGHTGERAVSDKTSGLIGMGEEVTFEGRHFGILLRHTSRITAFDPPRHFRDEMVRGQFKLFRHDHYFEPTEWGTRMADLLEFESPAGLLGRLVNRVFLTGYLKRLLQIRNAAIKKEAESTVQLSRTR